MNKKNFTTILKTNMEFGIENLINQQELKKIILYIFIYLLSHIFRHLCSYRLVNSFK
jgi:hypothetical protein